MRLLNCLGVVRTVCRPRATDARITAPLPFMRPVGAP